MPCRADRKAKRGGEWKQAARPAAAAAALLLLASCADPAAPFQRLYNSNLGDATPIDWWHALEGGVVAEQRPPPPGVGDPYPNLAEVPARPAPTDATTRRSLAATLAAERDRTRLQNAQDPLVIPVPAVAAKPAQPTATPATPDPGLSTASLETASATPAPPPAVPEPDEPMPAGLEGPAVPSGPIPALPGAPPPLPRLPGLPSSIFAPATPRPRPAVAVRFSPASATLRPADEAALQALVTQASGGPIAVSAGGDPGGGLDLAWRRVQAIGARLAAAGVTPDHIRREAHADGRDGRAILID